MACKHRNISTDPRPWPTGETVEICEDCGRRRLVWHGSATAWQVVPGIERARLAMECNLDGECRALVGALDRDAWLDQLVLVERSGVDGAGCAIGLARLMVAGIVERREVGGHFLFRLAPEV